MKMNMIKTMMSMSILSMMMKSPMSMGLMLMVQTLLSIMLMNSINPSSWMPMITFITMVGGLLIIFMYMSSITSNEKFKTNLKLIIITMLIMILTEDMMSDFQNQEIQKTLTNKMMISMSKMYTKSMMMTMMMIMYLLLTMMSVNKIIKMFEGPLRSKTYE